MSMSNQELVVGGTYSISATFYDTDGSTALDMTNRVGYLRLRSKRTTGAVTIERRTDNTDHFTWTVQASGTGTWLFKSSESLATGAYDAEVWVTDNSTPTVRRKVSGDQPANYTITDPETGAF